MFSTYSSSSRNLYDSIDVTTKADLFDKTKTLDEKSLTATTMSFDLNIHQHAEGRVEKSQSTKEKYFMLIGVFWSEDS